MDKAENARKGKMGEKGEEGHKKSMAEELYDGSANKAVDVKSAWVDKNNYYLSSLDF